MNCTNMVVYQGDAFGKALVFKTCPFLEAGQTPLNLNAWTVKLQAMNGNDVEFEVTGSWLSVTTPFTLYFGVNVVTWAPGIRSLRIQTTTPDGRKFTKPINGINLEVL